MARYDFGGDLKKLFGRTRESEDLSWLELLPASLLEREAGKAAIDAGRVSCPDPFRFAIRGGRLWLEVARRTGRKLALDRAARCFSDAQLSARPRQRVIWAVHSAEATLLRYDLFGSPILLHTLVNDLQTLEVRPGTDQQAVARLIARARARLAQAAMDGPCRATDEALTEALRGLDGSPEPAEPDLRDSFRLERASLSLQAGVLKRDRDRLAQAQRDLTAVIEAAPAEERPLTRARALLLAAAGLRALGAMAGDLSAWGQGQVLMLQAADLFTADHAPLDWAAVQLAGPATLADLRLAEALTDEPGLILGALALHARSNAELTLAAATGEVRVLAGLRQALLRQLQAQPHPVTWAAIQLALADLAVAESRLSGVPAPNLGLMRAEAELTAREHGAPALADLARG